MCKPKWKINNRRENGHALLDSDVHHIQWFFFGFGRTDADNPGSYYYTPFME